MLAAWLKKAYMKEAEEKARAEIRAIALAELRKMDPGVSAAEALRRLEIAFDEAERRRQSAA